MSVYGSIKRRLSSMSLGNDEHAYAYEQLIAELTSEEKSILADELDVIERLRSEHEPLTVIPPEEYEAAFLAAGIVDNR